MSILNNKQDILCIDISDLSFKIARLKKQGNHFSLENWGSFKLPNGIIVDGEIKNQESFIEIFQNSLSSVSGKRSLIKNIAISLPEDKTFTRIIPCKDMDLETAKDYVKLEAEKYIPIPLDQVYIDMHKVDGMPCILLAAIPKEIADSYAVVFKTMGYDPLIFEPKCISTSRCLVKNSYSDNSILIIDLGARRTHLTIFHKDSVFYSVNINLSANNLTQEIAVSKNIDFKQAESIKIKEGDKNIENEFFNELFKQIDKYLEFYSNNNACAGEIKEIILTGGGSNLKGIEERFSKKYNILCKKGDVWINILEQPIKKVPNISFQESNSYSCVLGLAIRAANFDI